MITEQLMGIGTWDVPLVADTPDRVKDLIRLTRSAFAHLVVTAVKVEPAALSYTALRSQALYVGVYRRFDNLHLGGGSPALLLGDEDGKGEILATRVTLNAQTLSTWVSNLLPSNGITAGTVMASGSITGDFQYVTRRAVLDNVCATAGAQWRINPDLTLDANTSTALFTNWTSPTAIVHPKGSGRELGRAQIGIIPTDFSHITDVEDYTTKVYQITREEGLTVATAALGSVPFLVPGSATAIKMERVADGAESATASASALATNSVAIYGQVRSAVTISTKEYLLPDKVGPGDGLLLWDPQLGLFDATNPVIYEGVTTWPMKVQVRGVTWPVTSAMGVYLILPENGTPTIVDLTPFVVPEDDQDSRLELATRDIAVLGGGTTAAGLAPTGDVTLKSLQAWNQVNSTLTSSGTSPTLGSGGFYATRYKRVGQTVRWRATLVFGSGATFGTGAWFLQLPVTAETSSGLGRVVGEFVAVDASAGVEYLGRVRTDGSGYAHGAALNLSATSPMTWAAGDSLDAWGSYEAA